MGCAVKTRGHALFHGAALFKRLPLTE